MSTPELSRMVKHKPLPAGAVEVVANAQECAALARRFGISAVTRLTAEVELAEDGAAISADGTLQAELVQPCAVSGEDFVVEVQAPIALRFVAASGGPLQPDLEIELADDQLDEIEFTGDMFDLGEAVAQTLALAIDLYAEGPTADAARAAAGIVSDDTPRGPLADALAALSKS